MISHAEELALAEAERLQAIINLKYRLLYPLSSNEVVQLCYEVVQAHEELYSVCRQIDLEEDESL